MAGSGGLSGWVRISRLRYAASRTVGDRWLDEEQSAVLCVPSMTARPHELHYIINPQHPDTCKLKRATPHAVIWDPRLE